MVRTYLKKEQILLGFIDNNAELQKEIIAGFPVMSLEKALENQPDLIIIAVMNAEQNDLIVKELMEKGIGSEQMLSVRSMKEFLDLRFSIARLIALEINSRSIPGAVAELGVYQGEFAALINELYPDRQIYLFDTFNGFNPADIALEKAEGFSHAGVGDFQDTSLEIVMNKLVFPEQAVFCKGYFPDTAEGIQETFAFVSIDADLYNPVYEGLKYFYPRMSQGGYILIHDYNNDQYKGAGSAVKKYCSENNLFVVPLGDVHGSAVLIKR